MLRPIEFFSLIGFGVICASFGGLLTETAYRYQSGDMSKPMSEVIYEHRFEQEIKRNISKTEAENERL